MRTYTDKTELIAAIQTSYQKYIAEFAGIPDTLKDKRIPDVDRTPSENLAYQLGWLNLLLRWDQLEQQGQVVHTPAPGYKWNDLGGLYQSFYQQYGQESLQTQIQALNETVTRVIAWVDTLSDSDLFEPGQRQWATTAAKWPLWKWIHINSMAPFTNFRTKIRKWKKLNNHNEF
ncbi:hypothetical protein FC83_GL001745 [Agrilactobacillus composti DSM 18527 = JCM 14202]|uniref:Cytoplasmic protein n=1 Tax=Agrilactobacillus composti DSM 18527 = JCM 14202 TaxID=1423734 RepID=X0PCH1_9LACO|nr:ClbS/DfsB family four-helix bundle protein [Agrilactobacillus composti]KRM30609.1 hypothetical protein FC83_GL001745 [Agrilactobacillus composti DSM 18527 = JCM 14202]GAF38309.1 hypothetical protein JCM14202_111 [Agrilactobacillus composti DSM 18527 = JCM 14202]